MHTTRQAVKTTRIWLVGRGVCHAPNHAARSDTLSNKKTSLDIGTGRGAWLRTMRKQHANEQIVRLWELGADVSEIAEQLGISTNAVRSRVSRLRREGVPLHKRSGKTDIARLTQVAAKARQETQSK